MPALGDGTAGPRATSTLLTLVVVPVLYSYLVRDRKKAPLPGTRPLSGGAAMPSHMPASKD